MLFIFYNGACFFFWLNVTQEKSIPNQIKFHNQFTDTFSQVYFGFTFTSFQMWLKNDLKNKKADDISKIYS